MKKIVLLLMTLLTFKVCAQQLPLYAVQTDANGVAWTLRNGSIYDFFLLQQSSVSFSNAVNAVVVGGGGGGGSVSNIVIQGGTNIRVVLTSGGGIDTNTLSVTGVVANASIALNSTNAQLAQIAVTATNAQIALNSTNAQLATVAVTATNAPDGFRSASTNDVRVSLQAATNGVSYASQLLDATNKLQTAITAATNGVSYASQLLDATNKLQTTINTATNPATQFTTNVVTSILQGANTTVTLVTNAAGIQATIASTASGSSSPTNNATFTGTTLFTGGVNETNAAATNMFAGTSIFGSSVTMTNPVFVVTNSPATQGFLGVDASNRTTLVLNPADSLSSLVNTEVVITGATNLTSAAVGKWFVCSGTNYNFVLPAVTGQAGKSIGIRIDPSATNLVTVKTSVTTEAIDGSTNRVLWANEVAVLKCDGTNWTKVAGKTIPMTVKLQRQGSNQTVTGASLAQLVMDTKVTGMTSMFDSSNGRVSILRSGQYLGSAFAYMQTGTAVALGASLNAVGNSSNINTGASSITVTSSGASFFNTFDCLPGDYLVLWIYAYTSDATMQVGTGINPQLTVTEIPTW